jgi:hypothetical protein
MSDNPILDLEQQLLAAHSQIAVVAERVASAAEPGRQSAGSAIDGRRPASASIRRRFARRLGPRPLALVFGVLVLGGSAAAAVVSLTASRPLDGSLPAGVGPIRPAVKTQYRISVFPYMTVGWSGWCSSANFTAHSRQVETDYGCEPVENSSAVVYGPEEFGTSAGDYQYEIVSDKVAAVRYSTGATIAPASNPRLPEGTRVVVYVNTPTKPKKLGRFLLSLPPQPTLLDAYGRVITVPAGRPATNVEHLPLQRLNAKDPAGDGCTVRARPLPGLVALTQTVTTPVRWPRHQPGAFLACANATYRLAGTRLAAAVLVNATNPAKAAPTLPGLAAARNSSGVFTAGDVGSIGFPQGLDISAGTGDRVFNTPTRQQALKDHDVSARRAGNGWLIVEGGSATQRATLLAALTTHA